MVNTNLVITDNDNENAQLQTYINANGKIFVETGQLTSEFDYYKGWCTLDKEDAKALVKELNKLIKQMP
jgi:hypothetical protein